MSQDGGSKYGVYANQQGTGEKIFDLMKGHVEEDDCIPYLKINVLVTVPSGTDLKVQTLKRLQKFDKDVECGDNMAYTVVQGSTKMKTEVPEFLKRIPKAEDELFLIVVDECHWGQGEGGLLHNNLFRRIELKKKNVLVLHVSATPYTTQKYVDEENIINLELSDKYYGLYKCFTEGRFVAGGVIEKPKDLAKWYNNVFAETQSDSDDSNEVGGSRTPRSVLKQFLDEKRMILVRFNNTADLGDFEKEMNKLETTYGFNVYSDTGSNPVGDAYENLELPCFILLVKKGKMGVTFPSSLLIQDLRLKYKGNYSADTFFQDIGRSFGFKTPGLDFERETYLIISKKAFKGVEVVDEDENPPFKTKYPLHRMLKNGKLKNSHHMYGYVIDRKKKKEGKGEGEEVEGEEDEGEGVEGVEGGSKFYLENIGERLYLLQAQPQAGKTGCYLWLINLFLEGLKIFRTSNPSDFRKKKASSDFKKINRNMYLRHIDYRGYFRNPGKWDEYHRMYEENIKLGKKQLILGGQVVVGVHHVFVVNLIKDRGFKFVCDMGAGKGKLEVLGKARLENVQWKSYDLQTFNEDYDEGVSVEVEKVECMSQIKDVRFGDGKGPDCVVFCLSFMDRDIDKFFKMARRILREEGIVICVVIEEYHSSSFVEKCMKGYDLTRHDIIFQGVVSSPFKVYELKKQGNILDDEVWD